VICCSLISAKHVQKQVLKRLNGSTEPFRIWGAHLASRRTRGRGPGYIDRGTTSNPTLSEVYKAMLPWDEAEHDETILSRVYAILDAEACQVKIGMTVNITRRLGELSSERGRAVEVLGTMRGGYDLERAMHGRFRRYRRERREWYSTEILGELIPLLDAA
jgi:hypothetical protein